MSDLRTEKPAPAGKGRDDLAALEYPRQLHKPAPAGSAPPPELLWRRVESADEAQAAVADGWFVDANEALAQGAKDAKPAKDAHDTPAHAK
jgi:hypothetical protein